MYGWALTQKLSVGTFKWVENTSQFGEDFLENYNEDSDEDIEVLKLMLNIMKKLHDLSNHFTLCA